MPVTRLFARWVAPMSSPVIENAGVAIDAGRVVGVGFSAEIRRQFDGAAVDYGDAVILPGLVNAHTHLELSALTPGPRPASFVDWVLGLMPRMTGDPADAVRAGIDECRRFGVTSVGDITTNPPVVRPVLAGSGLRGVSYGEVRGMAQRRGLVVPRVITAVTQMPPPMIAGISPHAPYSIEFDGYRRCVAAARENGMAVTTHLAETVEEAEFLAHQTGPFRRLWSVLNAWDDAVPRFGGGPIQFAEAVGLLDCPAASLAHVNYTTDDDLDRLARGRASVVYCPRTHDFFGHPPHRWRDMLARGINVAVGTDSRASSPDLNLVDDLRLMHRTAPEIDPAVLWEMATTRAARAVGINAGTIRVGGPADLAVFMAGDHPLQDVLTANCPPLGVYQS